MVMQRNLIRLEQRNENENVFIRYGQPNFEIFPKAFVKLIALDIQPQILDDQEKLSNWATSYAPTRANAFVVGTILKSFKNPILPILFLEI